MNFQTLYYKNPYATEFHASVISCTSRKKGYVLTLNQTLFYPEGGGQPADTGILLPENQSGQDPEPIRITDVQLKGNEILHFTDLPVPEGTPVLGRIDWNTRFERMQEHTGEHIISGLAHRAYRCENVGFHMADVITLDLDRPVTKEQLAEIETQANEIIFQNRPVTEVFPSEEELPHLDYRSKKELEGPVRLINIDGADSCACCGLHVKRTGEIGLIKILTLSHYKSGVRIEMLAGRKAFRCLSRIYQVTLDTSRALNVKPQETGDAVSRLREEIHEKDQRIASLNSRYFTLRCSGIEEGSALSILFEEGLNGIEIRKFCDLLIRSGKTETAAVLVPEGKDIFRYCIGSRTRDLRAAAPELNRKLNGRGGGKPEMIQGTFHASADEIRTALEALL